MSSVTKKKKKLRQSTRKGFRLILTAYHEGEKTNHSVTVNIEQYGMQRTHRDIQEMSFYFGIVCNVRNLNNMLVLLL